MELTLWSTVLRSEEAVITLRHRARRIAAALGFDIPQQTRVATAVSEATRNCRHASADVQVEFRVQGETPPQLLTIVIVATSTGSWMDESAILSARRLVDRCEIDSRDGTTSISLRRVFPRGIGVLGATDLRRISQELHAEFRASPVHVLDELQQQNQELATALREVETRQQELARVNAELSDTNRGVLSLYAELDERADHLRRADEIKTRFLSDMTHEFRTPLNSVIALSGILLAHTDGKLSVEQEKQVSLIRTCASDLLELVNDLLDIAKVEAGKVDIRPAEFAVSKLFAALRGMLRPLLVAPINLVFEETDDCPIMFSDEAKVSQILRNFLSNALKFTERGEVRVSAQPVALADGKPCAEPDAVLFAVADTGYGIAPEDHERIFQDFSQIENPYQARVRGTGLGLPLSRKLTEMLGGRIWLESELGKGSTFFVLIPAVWTGVDVAQPVQEVVVQERTGIPVLVLDDSAADREVVIHALRHTPFVPVTADSLFAARREVEAHRPIAAIVDISLGNDDSWRYIAELKQREMPVMIASVIDDRRKAFALGADAYAAKPVDAGWLQETLYRLTLRQRLRHVMIADDDEAHRYALRSILTPVCARISEADNGLDAIARIEADPPDLLIVDWVMSGADGFEVIRHVRGSPNCANVTILLCTANSIYAREREFLHEHRICFHSKDDLGNLAVLRSVVICVLAPTPPAPTTTTQDERKAAAASASR